MCVCVCVCSVHRVSLCIIVVYWGKDPQTLGIWKPFLSRLQKASNVTEQKLVNLCPLWCVCVAAGINAQCLWRGEFALCALPLQKSLHLCQVLGKHHSRVSCFQNPKSSQPLSGNVDPGSCRVWNTMSAPRASPNSTHHKSAGLWDAFSPWWAIQLWVADPVVDPSVFSEFTIHCAENHS